MAEAMMERIKIRFDGLEAADGSIPIEDLTHSLQGWEDFLVLSASMFQAKKFSTASLNPDECPKVLVEAPERGSFEIGLVLLMFPAAIFHTLELKDRDDVQRWLQKCMQWVKSLFDKHLEYKKGNYTTEQAAEALKKLAEEHEIEPAKDPGQIRKVTEHIDKSLKNASFPVSRSASTMSVSDVTSQSFKLNVDYSMRQHLHSGYQMTTTSEHYFPARIIVTGFYRKTGRCHAFVEESPDGRFVGRVSGRVAERDFLDKPRDPYSGSLHCQEAMDIWVVPEPAPKNSETMQWEFYLTEPRPVYPLLESTEGE